MSSSIKDYAKQIAFQIGERRGALFPSRYAKAYSRRAIQMMAKQIAEEAGLAVKINPHVFRHTQFGDFIGGVVGALWSLAGVILCGTERTEKGS